MLFILYRMGIFLALNLPLKASYWVAATVSSAYSFISRNDRNAVKSNLRILYPDYDEARINRLTTATFVNFAKYLVDFFRFSKVDKEYIEKNIKINGIENLDAAFKENKGVILAAAHLGNWELGGVVVSILGYPFAAVVLDHKHTDVNEYFIKQREAKGVEVISIGAGLRRCFKALSDNHAIALVGDRDYYDSGIEMDFFGKATIIPKGPAIFSRRCGSPIIPCFLVRNDDDTFTFSFHKPIRSRHTKDEHQDLAETTTELLGVLEKTIREHPGQWCVFREFWKKIGWKR
ncbi:MAG: lysophospholipid acyltransferase family protein [Candidatus Omnitrophica bacterium]|nr:lysophospholipid acyltransferase family protein [Candidatus Omnitrophota bacterium]